MSNPEAEVQAAETEPSRLPAPPPLPVSPPQGTADVRILPGFPTHFFVIPHLELTISQDTWTNVPLAQVAEITQIAAENQVLLEVNEGS